MSERAFSKIHFLRAKPKACQKVAGASQRSEDRRISVPSCADPERVADFFHAFKMQIITCQPESIAQRYDTSGQPKSLTAELHVFDRRDEFPFPLNRNRKLLET